MFNIAHEFYKLSRTKDNLPKKRVNSRVKYLEECYVTAVSNVTKENQDSLKNRWDIRILSNGVQKVENVSKNIYKGAEKLNDRIKWTGRAFNEQLKKRAKSVEYVRTKIVKRVRSQQKNVKVVFKYGKELVQSTYNNTRKKTVELRLKLHKKVDSVLITPAKTLSSNCVKRIKPYYTATTSRFGEMTSHSKQAVCDIIDSLVETSLECTKPLRAKTTDVILPVMSQKMKLVRNKYDESRALVSKRIEPITETVMKNKACMHRLFGFTWELLKNAISENIELVQQIGVSNKEFFNQYMGDVDLEVYYTNNKSFSIRELLVACTTQLMAYITSSKPEEHNSDYEVSESIHEEDVQSDIEEDQSDIIEK